jgi:hypothetical protein
MSCIAGQHRAPLAVPALHQIEQVGRGLGVDRVERLVEHDHAGILQQQPREQHALHLPAGERRDRAILEAGEPDGGDRLLDPVPRRAIEAAEQPGPPPQPHRHHVVDIDREGAVDLGGLRQIGDILCGTSPRSMRPASGLIRPTMPLNSVDLPAPFGPTTATSAPVSIAPSR